MDPPWKKHPEIPVGSIGWRMGGGEEYYDTFYRWFSSLTGPERAQFAAENPPPAGWTDIYKTIAEHPWLD